MAKEIAGLLEQIGYAYFKVEEPINIEEVIIKILLGKEQRFIKAIPFVIYLTAKNKSLSFDVESLLKKAKEKKLNYEVKTLLYLTIKILCILDKDNMLITSLQKKLTQQEQTLFNMYFPSKEYPQFNLKRVSSSKKKTVYSETIAYINLSFDEYLYDFIAQKKLYEAHQQLSLAEKMNKEKEYDLQYALHILFKPKQKEIIQKIIDGIPLTKVEYDYYFKTIKKRLRAVKLFADFADVVIQKKISKE